MNHRVVWGLQWPLANELIRQGEGIALPRLADVVEDVLGLLRDFGSGQISFLGTDVAGAFHQ
eukprot:15443104-Alexandrium_andersonii.AAC.1